VPAWDDMCVVRTLGELALRSHDAQTAARLAEDALRAGSATPRGEARVWNLLAIARNTMGDLAGASEALDHCLRAEEAAGLDTFLATTHGNYAEALMGLGDPEGAARHQLAALELARSMGQATLIAYSHMVAARFALEDGHAADAVRLQSAADSILAREGVSLYAGDEEQRVALLESARGTSAKRLRTGSRRRGVEPSRRARRRNRSDAAAPSRAAIDHRRMTMAAEGTDDVRRPYRDRIAVLPGDPPIAYRPGRVLVDHEALVALKRFDVEGTTSNRSSR
jgi:tetratricopeptide (TPR) repeat protein